MATSRPTVKPPKATSRPTVKPPKVLVHGIFAWGEQSCLRGSCWPVELRSNPDYIVSECMGTVSSAHDRACELFFELYGGRVDYGAEHACCAGHRRYGHSHRVGKWPRWSADAPIDLVGHSYGGNVAIDLALKLRSDFFGVGSDERWIRSIVTLSAPINGTTLVYLMGLSLTDHRTVRWFSFIHLFGAVAASFWALTVHLPLLRHLYDFKQPQWEHHTSFWDIWMMRHRMIISEDNAFHDLAPPRRHAHNPCAADLATTFLFSVSSQVNARLSLCMPPPWSQRKLDVVLPVGSWNPAVLFVVALIQLYSVRMRLLAWCGFIVPPFEGAASGAWARSDGVVNTYSQSSPKRMNDDRAQAEQVRLTLPVDDASRLQPGVWHRMHLGRHHNATKDLSTILSVAQILDSLPACSQVQEVSK